MTSLPWKWAVIGAVVIGAGIGLVMLKRLPSRSGGDVRTPGEDLALPATQEECVADAKRLADKLMASFPNNPQALLLGGRIYYAVGSVIQADHCWDKCLKMNPELAQAWSSRGEAAWEHGRFDEAADHLKRALEHDPQLAQEQVFLLADALMNAGRADETVVVLEKAAARNPLPPFGLLLLGNAYLETDEFEKAQRPFEQVLVVDSESAKAHYGLARSFAGLSQSERAREHTETYARLKRTELDQSSRSRAGQRQIDQGDVRPLLSECYLNAGKIYALHGDVAQTEKLWLRAVAVDPDNPKPRTLLEMLYRQQGRREEAIHIARGTAREGTT